MIIFLYIIHWWRVCGQKFRRRRMINKTMKIAMRTKDTRKIQIIKQIRNVFGVSIFHRCLLRSVFVPKKNYLFCVLHQIPHRRPYSTGGISDQKLLCMCALSLSRREQRTACMHATAKNQMNRMCTSTICHKSNNFLHENQLCSQQTNKSADHSIHIQHKKKIIATHFPLFDFDSHSLRWNCVSVCVSCGWLVALTDSQ